MAPLDLLLDDQRLHGVRGVERDLGPDRLAACVDRESLSDAHEAIQRLCLAWGGSTGLLIPHRRGDRQIDERWARVLADGVIDELAWRDLGVNKDETDRHPGIFEIDHIGGDSLLAHLFAQDRSREAWPTVDARLPDPEDPWYVGYLGVLGDWPQQPAEPDTYRAGLVEGFEFEQLVRVERGTVDRPDSADLIARLRAPGRIAPARLCNTGLGLVSRRRAGDMISEPFFTREGWRASEVGPNIVVVYATPASVEDLCLLWNLRAVQGVPVALPFGVPFEHAEAVLATWSRVHPAPQVLLLWGLVTGRPWALVSTSVPMEELERLAAQAGRNWTAIGVDELLWGGDRAGRISTDTAMFNDGRAEVPSWSAADRDLLTRRPSAAIGPSLRVRLWPEARRLPRTRTFLRFLPHLEGYQGGGQEFQGSHDRLQRLDWPSGWNVLRAVIRDRECEVVPSRPGRAAVALLQRLGSFSDVYPLLLPELVNELYRLGERSGISYFKARVRDIQSRVDSAQGAERARAVESELAEMRMRPLEGEQRDLTFDRLRRVLGPDNARTWLAWAEDRGLLVRGVAVECERCGAKSWRTTDELAPPVVCRGCGEVIRRPFRPDHLVFRYRSSQLLLDVLALDVLPHIFALRWLVELLGGNGGLYGGHPGVEFRDSKGELIGEADVVLVFQDGSIALGECKLSPGALTEDDVAKHEALADALGATWTFYATPRWAKGCPDPWPTLSRRLPDRVRCALTAEHVIAGEAHWTAPDPFAWRVASDADQQKHTADFLAGLGRAVGWLQEPMRDDQVILDEP